MKKSKIAWITDTTSSLTEEFVKQYNIHVVPLSVVINDVPYKETIEITEKEIYERMYHEVDATFKTSLPSLGDFVDLYEKLKEEYEFGIAIHASSKLTGTYNTSVMAAEMVGFKLYHLDSMTGSYPLSFLIHRAVELVEQGVDIEEVMSRLKELTHHTRILLIPANLNQLHKSGRVSGSQKLMASLFQIKPILAIENGKAIIKEKVRSQKRAMSYILNVLKEECQTKNIKKVTVLHANDDEKASELELLVKEAIPDMITDRLMLISVAGVHTGAKTVGLSWVCE